MPIYAYRCEACGHAQDVLQKISDPVLTECPKCQASAFRKQVTAAGFQLKGSGWYATDFRGGTSSSSSSSSADSSGGGSSGGDAGSSASASSEASASSSSSSAGGCGTSCACH